MSLEDTLTQTFQARLDTVDLPTGDPVAARRTGERMRVRRRAAAGGAVAATVVIGVVGSLGIARHDHAGVANPPTGSWRQLPTPPLSPREDALVVWTGREELVIGGDDQPCPPGASCLAPVPDAVGQQGAAYDPSTNTWRRIAQAPVAVGSFDAAVVARGTVVVQTGRTWATYDPRIDIWGEYTGQPKHLGPPTTYDGVLYGLSGDDIASYDTASQKWSTLPPDPIEPRLTQRAITATNAGVVVTGFDATHLDERNQPALVLADLYDGTTWRRLPASDQLSNDFSWTGHRMVDPDPFTENGGEVDNWGRDIPHGGTLDPATGTWGRLPAALTGEPGGWTVPAPGDGPWFAVAGQVYNDDTGEVSSLPRPDGGPDMDMAGAWADGRLVAFGGVDSSRGFGKDALTNHAWIYTP